MRKATGRYVAAGIIAFLSVVGLGAQGVATPQDALARLRDYVGVSPKECGRHEQLPADAGAVTASVQCVVEAAQLRRPSWMLLHAKGVDSWMTGVLSGSDGVVRRFFYDSKPPTGKSGPMVEVVPCAAPKILAKQSGSYAGFDCSPAASR
jgi:hypothetical protein